MTTPKGIAEFSPAIPTSGDVTAPNANCKEPSTAEALPAICPCDSMANVKEIGPMIPMEKANKKIEINMADNAPCTNTTNKTAAEDMNAMINPILNSRFSGTRPANNLTNCDPAMIARPFNAKRIENIYGDTPYMF